MVAEKPHYKHSMQLIYPNVCTPAGEPEEFRTGLARGLRQYYGFTCSALALNLSGVGNVGVTSLSHEIERNGLLEVLSELPGQAKNNDVSQN